MYRARGIPTIPFPKIYIPSTLMCNVFAVILGLRVACSRVLAASGRGARVHANMYDTVSLLILAVATCMVFSHVRYIQ